jgi:hypothetical protein
VRKDGAKVKERIGQEELEVRPLKREGDRGLEQEGMKERESRVRGVSPRHQLAEIAESVRRGSHWPESSKNSQEWSESVAVLKALLDLLDWLTAAVP